MRVVVITACLAAAPLLAHQARALDIEAAFNGTLVSTYPDGRQAHMWLQRDGSYNAENRRQKPSSGTWKLSGEKICFKQKKPYPAPLSYCTRLPPTLDESWSGKAPTGEPVSVTLVDGR